MLKKCFFLIDFLLLVSLTISNTNIPATIMDTMMNVSTSKELFKIFDFIFQKNYDMSTQLARDRYATFKKHLQMMKQSTLSHQIGFSEYFDLTDEEFKDNLNMILETKSETVNIKPSIGNSGVFPAVSWHKHPCATNSFEKGGSDSFSTTIGIVAAIEIRRCLKNNNKSLGLSIQQIIDCTPKANDFPTSYELYTYNIGLANASDYPYTNVKGTCKDSKIKTPYRTFSWEFSPHMWDYMALDIDTIYAALVRGPIVVSFNFYQGLSTYKSGILNPPSSNNRCSYYWHGVVVGYGVENKVEYWVVKGYNGFSWGENGYFRLIRKDSTMNWGISCGYSRPI